MFIEFNIFKWGLGIGDWGLGPIPNPQSPIPNPQSPIPIFNINLIKKYKIICKIYNIKIYVIIFINYFIF
jgi:hypothetical protein